MRSTFKSSPQYRDDFSDSDAEFELDLTSDQNKSKSNNNETGNALIIEKILGRKFVQNEGSAAAEELYFIKWKKLSYLHASWERRVDIETVDPQGKGKIKRFLLSPQLPGVVGEQNDGRSSDDLQALGTVDDEEAVDYFNPELAEIQRVISCDTPGVSHASARNASDLLRSNSSRSKNSAPTSRCNKEEEFKDDDSTADPESDVKYLVKWRGLPYNECTWERWAEIRAYYQEVWTFWQVQQPPKLLASKPQKFPSIQEYIKLTTSPIFGTVSSSNNMEICADDDDNEVERQVTATSSGAGAGLRLRDYQLEGVNWLLWNWWHRRSCILADEMGLGKTIQTVGFLHQLRYMATTRISGPFLIIAPLSLVDQWQSEVATWSPQMNCVLLHGSAEARELIIQHEFYYQEPFTSKSDVTALKRRNACKFHILLTTFEVASKEIKALSKIDWQVLIIDEAHKLKNQQSRLFTSLSTLSRQHTLLLTGTPLQNKTEELWALLNFADPVRFRNMEDFLGKFGDLKDASQVAKLHNMLRPYLLRRIKEDVEKSLPPKEETIVEVSLTSLQKKFYRAIFEKNTTFLFKGLKASNQPSLMNIMMELRKCCNHPYLVKGVEERVISELPEEDKHNEEILRKKLIESSGKFVLLDKLLPRLFTQGNKVLIFSQMVRVLNLLEDYMKIKGYSYERLDGSTKSSDRKESVSRFCKPEMQRFIMLMSTKAGGLGLNLTAADTVIIFDSDWNPQNDLQAQARAHRIGQTKAVMVYRLLTRKTYEMEMFHQASMKLGLDRAVLAHARNEQEGRDARDEEDDDDDGIRGAGSKRAAAGSSSRASKKSRNKYGKDFMEEEDENFEASNAGKLVSSASGSRLSSLMNAKEIDELLKRGAYDVFREDDTEQREFAEADIDSILQRSSHKVTYDNSGAAKVGSTLGSFSKASFVSADEKEDVDINDPDFWRKAVGLSETSMGILGVLDVEEILPQQRLRKQTKAYGSGTGDVNSFDDPELQELLKPINEDGSSSSSSTKGPGAQERKEAMLKERLEREEARQQKLQAEVKARNDIMTWGSHSRDRVLRALTMYGFGRWERIRVESGHANRELKSVETFSRLYVYQCGLAASASYSNEELLELGVAGSRSANDSEFVRDAMRTSRQVDALVQSGQQTLAVPATLTEDRFLNKLRTGQAKKILNKLDVLSRLVDMMQQVVEDAKRVRSERPQQQSPLLLEDDADSAKMDVEMSSQQSVGDSGVTTTTFVTAGATTVNTPSEETTTAMNPLDLDAQVNSYSIEELTEHVPLGEIRPTWAKLRPWWDLQCDAHLLLGVFKHGCGRFDLVRDDALLIFQSKLAQAAIDEQETAAATAAAASSMIDETTGIPSETAAAGTGEDFEINRNKDNIDEDGNVNSTAAAAVVGRGRGKARTKSTAAVVTGTAATAGPNGKKTNTASKKKGKGSTATLLSIDDGGGSADGGGAAGGNEMITGEDADDGEGGENAGGGGCIAGALFPDSRALNRLLNWLLCSDEARMTEQDATTTVVPAAELTATTATEKPSKGSSKKQKQQQQQQQSCVQEPRSRSLPMRDASAGGAPEDEEDAILSKLHEIIEVDAIATVYRVQIQGLKKCEALLKAEPSTTDVTSVSLSTEKKSLAETMLVEPMKLQHQNKDSTQGYDSVAALEALSHITEEEATRICAAFILYGAPLSFSVDNSTDDDEKNAAQSQSDNNTVNSRCSNNTISKKLLQRAFGFKICNHNNNDDDESIHVFCWEDILHHMKVPHTIQVLQDFYRLYWLPFCEAISDRSKALSLSLSQNNRLILPNPLCGIPHHHYAARGLCQIFLIRQQLLRAARYVLSDVTVLRTLMQYLRSSSLNNTINKTVGGGRNVENMPVWWCPWIHDVGLLIGLVKYGFLSLPQLLTDNELPFTRTYLESHIRQVFLYGCYHQQQHHHTTTAEDDQLRCDTSVVIVNTEPALIDMVHTTTAAECFVQAALSQFPDYKDIEFRILRILQDMTESLPTDHPNKVLSFTVLRAASFAPPFISSSLDDSNSNQTGGQLSDAIPIIPSVPLKTFLRLSSKRRKLYARMML